MSERPHLPTWLIVAGHAWWCDQPISRECAGSVEASHSDAWTRAEAHAVYHNSVESRT